MYIKTYTITEAELEPGYNHLNHAAILTLLERGRLDFLIDVGFPNEELHTRDLFLVIAHIDIHYKREIFSGENTVTVDAVLCEGKQMTIKQRVMNAKGKECVQATYDFRALSGTIKRSIVIPDELSCAMTQGCLSK